ncbi:MAG: thrombospondin type 3 repeat-containing protein [Chloroflexi bacterium]|nr:thrombospondin type 3 repeat-containing protein [Chloroflexota bacterium]
MAFDVGVCMTMDILTAVLGRAWGRWSRCFAALAMVSWVAAGCNGIPVGPGSGNEAPNDNEGEQTLKEVRDNSAILNLTANSAVSGSGFITLFYTVPESATSIDAFYVPVADTSSQAAPIGEQVVFAENLSPGKNVFTQFQIAGIEAGNYRLGLQISFGAESFALTTLGLVLIEDPPDPIFLGPTQDLFIDAGTDVNVTFDARKLPEKNVQWRLFFARFVTRDKDSDGVADGRDVCPDTSSAERESTDARGCAPTQAGINGGDFDLDSVPNESDECPATDPGVPVDAAGCSEKQLGTQIAAGSSNVGQLVWKTENVSIGTYRLGVSATDTGKSVNGTIEDGPEKFKRVVTRFSDATVTITPPPPLPGGSGPRHGSS